MIVLCAIFIMGKKGDQANEQIQKVAGMGIPTRY
ncbi:MAG: hypothetical protein QG552_2966 [Thermodesulfobacteriota bacterium]|nr:hypothetical protein [Thermodesulfobacteriota bacterium]